MKFVTTCKSQIFSKLATRPFTSLRIQSSNNSSSVHENYTFLESQRHLKDRNYATPIYVTEPFETSSAWTKQATSSVFRPQNCNKTTFVFSDRTLLLLIQQKQPQAQAHCLFHIRCVTSAFPVGAT